MRKIDSAHGICGLIHPALVEKKKAKSGDLKRQVSYAAHHRWRRLDNACFSERVSGINHTDRIVSTLVMHACKG